MDQFKTSDFNMGLLESPVTSWLDYESFSNIKNEDEDFSMEIIKTSDLEQFKELECIQEVEQSLALQEPVSENTEDLKQSILEEFFPVEVKVDEFENNNALINEVEKFLTSISGEETKIEEDIVAMNWDIDTADTDSHQNQPIMLPVQNIGSMNADQILDALTAGQVVDNTHLEASNTNTCLPTSFEAIDANGEKVIVVIAPPSPATSSISVASTAAVASSKKNQFLAPCSPSSYSEAMSPGSASSEPYSPGSVASSTTITSDDDEWRPQGQVSPRPRKKYERKIPKRKPEFAPYPKDKAERKKAQNRSAAWKYREKKKNEQDLVDQEFEGLLNRNIELKKTLGDMEIQLKVLKQLMIETGMAKYAIIN